MGNLISNVFFKHELTLEEMDAILHKEEDNNLPCEEVKEAHIANVEEDDCTYLITKGKVTCIGENFGLIDDIYKFNINVMDEGIRENTMVMFTMYKKSKHNDHKICKVSRISNSNEQLETWDTPNEREPICYEKKGNISTRRRTGEIVKREGRNLYIQPGNIVCNLDKIHIQFFPMIGDMVAVEVVTTVETDKIDLQGMILDIECVKPLRLKIHSGKITYYDDGLNQGVIDKEIFFRSNVCQSGYIPKLGDEVVAKAMESTQEDLTWRAISVIPVKERFDRETSKDNLFESKFGIVVTSDDMNKIVKLNELFECKIRIENCGVSVQVINQVILQSGLMTFIEEVIYPIKIEPNTHYDITFGCEAKCIGYCTEIVVLQFEGNWRLAHMLDYFVHSEGELVDSQTSSQILHRSKREQRLENLRRMTTSKGGQVVPGFHKANPGRLAIGNIPFYGTPKRIFDEYMDLCMSDVRIDQIKEKMILLEPSLKQELSYENYRSKFHMLLHLEEMENRIGIKKYNINRAILSYKGDFASVQIIGLSESRPSLSVGDKVCATLPDVQGTYSYESYIQKVRGSEILLQFKPRIDDLLTVDLDFTPSRTVVRRLHLAIDEAWKENHLGDDCLFPSTLRHEKDPQVIIAGEWPPCETQVERKSDGRKVMQHGCILKWVNKNLNIHQKEAVRNILRGEARPLPYIIFGPPGTGKTVTLVEAILQIFLLMPHSRIMVAAPSNSAADLICERLVDTGMLQPGDLVRLMGYNYAFERTIPEKLKPYCTIANLDFEGTNPRRVSELEKSTGMHRITVSTCASLGILFRIKFNEGHFSHIVIDEAGQTTEPELLIPLTFLSKLSGQAVLAGDPKQLGPVVTSRIALDLGLGISMMERFLSNIPYARDEEDFEESDGYNPKLVTKLLFNYRSLPEVIQLSSSLFYNNSLVPKVCPVNSEEASLLSKIAKKLQMKDNPSAVLFDGIRGVNKQDDDGYSWYNLQEIIRCTYYLAVVYNSGVNVDDVGIITPYRKQVLQLREYIKSLSLIVPKVGSVEEFQGQEKNVIIISTVRSSENMVQTDIQQSLGFVSSPNRLNVAITRAKALLIIVGNPHLLHKDKYWNRVLTYCVSNNCYVGCDLPLGFREKLTG